MTTLQVTNFSSRRLLEREVRKYPDDVVVIRGTLENLKKFNLGANSVVYHATVEVIS